MKLQLLAFGKLKTPGLRDAANYYAKMIQPWVSLSEDELKPLSVPDKGEETRRKIQMKEGAVLLARLSSLGCDRSFYLLEERGKALDTQAWADQVRHWEGASLQSVGICVGSSLGFSDDLRKRARGIFNLGSHTMSHELARVVLLEQLYRAWSVTRGHPYHNEGK